MIIYFTITALRLVILELVILPKGVFAKLLDRLAGVVLLPVGIFIRYRIFTFGV